jgi:hypothetical protein
MGGKNSQGWMKESFLLHFQKRDNSKRNETLCKFYSRENEKFLCRKLFFPTKQKEGKSDMKN